MPNCYYVTSSTPEEAANAFARCGTQYGGRPRFIGRARRTGRTVALIWYRTLEEAEANLDNIADCVTQAGHTVHERDILEDVTTDLGIAIEGYEPYPEPGSTAE